MAEEREKKADHLEEGIEAEDVEAHVKATGELEAAAQLDDDDEVKAHVKAGKD